MLGIALEGGGAKGSYQVGAFKALNELGIIADVIAGTSIGAVNGSFMAQGDLEKLESIWLNSDIQDVLGQESKGIVQLAEKDSPGDIQLIKQAVRETLKVGGIDITGFKEKFKEWLNEEELRTSKTDYGLVTLCISDRKPLELFLEDIPQGKLHDYILASAHFPVFKKDLYDGKKMIDGAFVDNLPIQMLLDKGCDEVIAIRLMSMGRVKKIKKKDQGKVKYIIPSDDLGHFLEVDKVNAEKNIKMGYLDTMKYFKGWHGRWFYLTDRPTEKEVFERLHNVSENAVAAVGALFNTAKSSQRILFEDVFPLLFEWLELKPEDNYADLVIALYEWMGKKLGIDRYQIFSFHQFQEEVHAAYNIHASVVPSIDEMVKAILKKIPVKGIHLLPKTLRGQLIQYWFSVLHEDHLCYNVGINEQN